MLNMHKFAHAYGTRRHQGVSLIEALVALAVMSFGILGLVGVQLTLHTNADIAKQRAQAVRIAQAAIEEWRGFTTLTLPLPTGHTRSFADIADVATTNVPAAATGIANTTYTITRTVQDTAAPLGKTVRVQVTWNDRSGAAQEVALSTHIAGILPDLSGAVSLPVLNPATREVRGRHFSIPLSAVNQGDGTSHFTPPGAAAGITWVFSNTTGLITSLCNPFPGSCTAINATLVTGYLRFALGGSAPLVAPTGTDAEFPTDLPPTSLLGTLGVEVQTVGPNATYACLVSTSATSPYLTYHCAVPLPSPPATSWTGTVFLTGLPLATSITSGSVNTDYRVCRYTPATSASTTVPNIDHPYQYLNVQTSLNNQNYLLIRAGNGSAVYACPGDGTSPLVNGNTLPHQPNV